MPQKNAIKQFTPESYYHIYARGSSKQNVFLDAADYKYFTALFERYLSDKTAVSKSGNLYPNYRKSLDLLAYCLMRNHFHLLIYQTEIDTTSKFMRSIMTSYSRYFNLKYKRSGAVFESRYKGKRIYQQSYLEHISRYIHLNPRYWEKYTHSSLKFYTGITSPSWLNADRITTLFGGAEDYIKFVRDYEGQKQMWDEIKHELADQ